MTKYMVLTGALLACQLFAGHAAAQNIDGGTLFADCREGDDPNARDRLFKQGHCFGYILGVADALRPAEVYCLPSGATVGQIVDVAKLYTAVFALGAALAALAGAMAGPVLAVRIGMGEDILILTFVVIVIGGIGSVRGALAGALLVGLVDTFGRAFLPGILGAAGTSLASMTIYIVMALVLAFRPRGLFPAPG